MTQCVQGYTAVWGLFFKCIYWQSRDLYRQKEQNNSEQSKSQRAEGKDADKQGRRRKGNGGGETLQAVAWQQNNIGQ